jgi:hypothetical protein
VAKEVDAATADRLSDLVRRVFGKVPKELADLDNPMRSPRGPDPGEGGVLVPEAPAGDEAPGPKDQAEREDEPPDLSELLAPPNDPVAPDTSAARPDRPGSSRLPSIAPGPSPGEARSRFDADLGVVFYNDSHADYPMVKDSEPALLDYLSTLVAKEYVVYNNPRASSTIWARNW